MNLETLLLDGPLGVEVVGLDLARPDRLDPEAIRAALAEHALLLFRRQFLDDDGLVRLMETLGRVQKPWNPDVTSHERPELNYVSNLRDESGRPIGGLGTGEVRWHSDNFYKEHPYSVSLTLAVLPSTRGGRTSWIHMGRAHATLPEALRKQIAGRRGVYARPDPEPRRRRWRRQRPPATISQPLEMTHPRRHDTCLYVSQRTLRIEGMDRAGSDALIGALLDHVIRPERQLVHVWRAGDLVLYDNVQTIHHREPFEGPRLLKAARFEIE